MNKPKHWTSLCLSKLVITRKGKKPDKLSFKKFPNCVPYLDILAIEKGVINQYADSYSTVLADSDDLFIVADGSRSGLIGKGKIGAVGSTILCITPISINSDYLSYFLKLKYEELNGNVKGASIPHLDQEYFLNLKVPFPSLEEQDRIVKELQSKLAIFETDFSKAGDELKKLAVFKKSLLDQVVQGQAKEIFGAKQSKTTGDKNWQNVAIAELSTFIGSGSTPAGGSTNYVSKGIPFIRSQNVHPNELRLDDVAYISTALHDQMRRSQLLPDDVLLNITGASIGRSACVPKKFGPGNVNQHVCIIRTNARILPEYLCLFLNSPSGQDSINNLQKGVTRQGLNYDQIRSIKIRLPTIDEQLDIINYIEEQDRNIRKLENQYSDKINNSSQLEKAVLQMAFEGALSSKESGDGDVSLILESIDGLREEIKNRLAEKKLNQSTIARPIKVKLTAENLALIIKNNFSKRSFTSEELFNLVEEGTDFQLFSQLLLDLLQEKLTEKDRLPFLELGYDKKINRQILKIKQ